MQNLEFIQKIKDLFTFYLSDSNLNKDRYLSNIIRSSDQGWIEIKEFYKFARLKALLEQNQIECLTDELLDSIFKSSGTQENAATSTTSTDIILSDDKTKIKRTTALKENDETERKDIDERTIYIEPILSELTDQKDIEILFKDIGPITYISIPRFPDKTPKGFAFIEFKEKQHSIEALNQINNNAQKFNHLISISKNEWLEKKKLYSYINHDNFGRILKIDGVPLSMTKPILWKLFDNYISVCYLERFPNTTTAILKFKTDFDLQHAIDLFHQGDLKYDHDNEIDDKDDNNNNNNNSFFITQLLPEEKERFRSKLINFEKSKQNFNHYKPKHGNNNNSKHQQERQNKKRKL
ncbi:hypothetical protein CYY_009049 [Polysphondylium violaceum]|uniref:La-related protein 7 n=1 Tax=Polysphondylium violaceum TaxID=133409 RepID=A0A8J4V0T4_9MYCE|nr:hypothetical protein CYY_009049 [Polysphondylium violaceum]